MKKLKNLRLLPLTVVGFLLMGTAAWADTLTLTLDSASQMGTPGSVFTFSGTIDYTSADAANDGSATEWLNGATVVFTGPSSSATYDISPFNGNAPLFMDSGESTGDIALFTVTLPASVMGSPEVFAGSFEILGGPSSDPGDPNGDLVLASEIFNIQVTPEPPNWQLLAMALMGLAGMMAWKARRTTGAV